MRDKYHTLQRIIIVILFWGIVTNVTGSDRLDLLEETLESIKDHMNRPHAPWPDEWNQEYLETIRKAVELHRDASHYTVRLEILSKGFAPCWESLTKTTERSLFEYYQARIRWYVEHLMGSKFPTEEERQKLRDQYTDIWDYAVSSLMKQFPFLDPNTVQKAKADDLSICYEKIDAPLMPVYLRPLLAEQVEQINQRWDKLCDARADLWHQLSTRSNKPDEKNDISFTNADRDYQLTKKSLSQLLGLVWTVVPQRPDYYLNAWNKHTEELKRRLQTKRNARSYQMRLENERSRQLLQVEHISFLLAALLETPYYLDEPPSIITQEQRPLEQQGKTAKGGGAYEIDNNSSEK